MPFSFVGFYSLMHLRWTFQLAATYAFRAMVDYNTPAVKNELVKLGLSRFLHGSLEKPASTLLFHFGVLLHFYTEVTLARNWELVYIRKIPCYNHTRLHCKRL